MRSSQISYCNEHGIHASLAPSLGVYLSALIDYRH